MLLQVIFHNNLRQFASGILRKFQSFQSQTKRFRDNCISLVEIAVAVRKPNRACTKFQIEFSVWALPDRAATPPLYNLIASSTIPFHTLITQSVYETSSRARNSLPFHGFIGDRSLVFPYLMKRGESFARMQMMEEARLATNGGIKESCSSRFDWIELSTNLPDCYCYKNRFNSDEMSCSWCEKTIWIMSHADTFLLRNTLESAFFYIC